MEKERFAYDNKTVRNFIVATIIWGLAGMLVGLLAACQLVWPDLNLTSWLTFGRIRPLHTNAVIFAFVGNGIFRGGLLLVAAPAQDTHGVRHAQ